MTRLGVIGNISIDTARYPGGQTYRLLGGAALHLALAASQAGTQASPIAVVGDDLAHLHSDPRLNGLDMRRVLTVGGPDCRFDLTYDLDGRIASVDSAFGVADVLTLHASTVVDGWDFDHWHVACRRPLDAARILRGLTAAGASFSVDFHLPSADDLIPATAAWLPPAGIVFVNAAEHQILHKHLDTAALPALMISNGPEETILLRHGAPAASAIPPTVTAREVTGAGDTLAGTFLALIQQGATDQTALTAAVAAASRHAASPGLRYRPRT